MSAQFHNNSSATKMYLKEEANEKKEEASISSF